MNKSKNLYAPYLIMYLWIGVAFVAGVLKAMVGPEGYNNYLIFEHSFFHLIEQANLYLPYPAEYQDLFLYGPFFSLLVAPFAMLPQEIGLILWVTANAALLLWGISLLPFNNRTKGWITLFSINELYTSACMQQFNIGIVAMIILAYALIEKKHEFMAAFFIMLGGFTKIYGIIGLAFFLFSKDKVRFVLFLLFWGIVMFVAPMLFTSADYVLDQYKEWFLTLSSKNGGNAFAVFQNVSLLGMVRKISGNSHYSDLWILLPALVLMGLPYMRRSQYKHVRFRLLLLSSLLLFLVLFSTGSESGSYIIAFPAVAIWFYSSVDRHKYLNRSLFAFAFIFGSLSATDLCPREIRIEYFLGYALKAFPYTLVWLKIGYELIFLSFEEEKEKLPATTPFPGSPTLTLILPCFNPPSGWPHVMKNQFEEVKQYFHQESIHLILVDDGSTKGFSEQDKALFNRLIPEATLISLPQNKGKGAAVRAGVEKAQTAYIIYTDYDFPYQLSSLYSVLEQLKNGADVVVVRRNISYHTNKGLTAFRKFMSISSRIVNRWMLGMKYNDAQAGLKGMNQKGKSVFMQTKTNTFLFDTEFVYRASCQRESVIAEVNVDLRDGVSLSDMGGKVFVKEIGNLMKILFYVA